MLAYFILARSLAGLGLSKTVVICDAIDPMTGDVKWEHGVEIPRIAGTLATGGNLVFTGTQTGEFEAFDASTKRVWSFNTGSGIVGQPMTWEMDGKQYVSIVNGGGAVYALC